jgi:hypothetical protein
VNGAPFGRTVEIAHIVGCLQFVPSCSSFHLQLCDLCLWVIQRVQTRDPVEQPVEELYDILVTRFSGAGPSALLVGVAPRFGRRSRLNEPRYKLLWQTVAIVASMLMFASLRPSTTDVTCSLWSRSLDRFGSQHVHVPGEQRTAPYPPDAA